MKILLYTDVHMNKTSSILRRRGTLYTERLENIIQSVNWAEELAETKKVDKVICLGDFFHSANLDCETITACKEIKWASKPHIYLVGNHESDVLGLQFNSTKTLQSNNFEIINEPKIDFDEYGNRLVFIPYITESERKSLYEYIDTHDYKLDPEETVIVFSHNDIKGIQYGPVISKQGFEVFEIENICSLFLNGHLHNGTQFSKSGYNLGNLSGQNFSEDASKYKHGAFILDTNTLELEFYENPYAFNFYKIDILKESDLNQLNCLAGTPVISIRCVESLFDKAKEYLNKTNLNIKFTTIKEDVAETVKIDDILTSSKLNYLQQFRDVVLEKFGYGDIIQDELSEILKEVD